MRAMAQAWVQNMVAPARLCDAPLLEAVVQMFERQSADIFRRQIRALLARPDASAVLQQVRVPTLVMAGEWDSWASTLQHHADQFAHDMDKGMTRSRLAEFVNSTREGADILMRGLQQAGNLVASFKQVAVDQTSEKRRLFTLSETVSEILLTLGPTLRKTSHNVHCDIAADIQMDSYPGALTQIITNLINNALLHAFAERENGQISITASLQGDWVTLSVCDNGVGIPAGNLSRVFDPFFTTRLGQGGSGLGLSIVYNLVQDILCGSISASNAAGLGACFTLNLPLVAPQLQDEQ